MKLNLAGKSLLLFGLSIVFLIALTLFESALTGTSLGMERLITFLLLILPSGAGAMLGVMSLFRKEGRALIAFLAIMLNTLFALFHLTILLFAG
ncbi:MAG: hypothetical protein H7Y59_14740 [Anaerolineales bacterium]|nr:hypothetical protein [Anaerolineales bacterium]